MAVLDYAVAARDNPDLGGQMADILSVRLSVEPDMKLVERARLKDVLAEQKLTLAGLTDPAKAARVGHLVGAKVLLLGRAFPLDDRLMIVTKLIGVETGRVVGTIRQVPADKELAPEVLKLSEDVSGLLRKRVKDLLPPKARPGDPVAALRKRTGRAFPRGAPAVAVVIPETHIRRAPPDPAAETEIKRLLVRCGFTVVDAGANALAPWARKALKGKPGPWPAAVAKADYIVVGEAFSEFALRTGDLVTVTGRAEINLIDRSTGRIVLADRATQRAIDLAELTAGKAALQACGRRLGLSAVRALLPPAERPQPATRPASNARGAALVAPPGFAPPAGPLVAALLAAAEATTRSTTDAPVVRTVFAAPLNNETGDDQYDPAAAGMGDLIGVLLAEQPSIRVVERQRLAVLAEEQARSLRGLSGRKYAIEAGRLLKADTALVGRLYLVGGKLMVHVQALELAHARVLAADRVDCRPEYMLDAALGLARKLASQLSLPLPAIDLERIDTSPIAGLHFAKALGHYYTGDLNRSLMHFMRAMDLDPDYVEAHRWMGMCYRRLGEAPHAVIEWQQYLRRCPPGADRGEIEALLAEARKVRPVGAEAAKTTTAPADRPRRQRGRPSREGTGR